MLPLARLTLPSFMALLVPTSPPQLGDAAATASALPAVRLPLGDDAVWVAFDGGDLFVAWGDDAPFESFVGQRPAGRRTARLASGSGFDAWRFGRTDDGVRSASDTATGAAASDALRVGLVDTATILLVDVDGAAATLARGSRALEPLAEGELVDDAASLRDTTLAPCSATGRWPASGLHGIHWIVWPPCADLVRCGPLRLEPARRRPIGVRVSLAVRAALDARTSLAAPTQSNDDEINAFAAAGRSLAIERRMAGSLALTLTLRFDARRAARARLSASLVRQDAPAPLGADVVDVLGADEARALVCGGRP